MGLFDIEPLKDLAHLADKYLQLGVVCFVSFWFTLGLLMGAALASGVSPLAAFVTAFSTACVVMSAAVWRTAKRSRLFRDISPELPEGLEVNINGTEMQGKG